LRDTARCGRKFPVSRAFAAAPTVQAEAGFTVNSIRHYGEVLREQRTDSLSHADVYAGLQAAIAILAACIGAQQPGLANTSTSRWRRP
jgi:crotonobetainyl-CoA:carnitine CoA-transferase CaiB-like acyl-CoA transferase